jgi:hypothetical protein
MFEVIHSNSSYNTIVTLGNGKVDTPKTGNTSALWNGM